jgi:PadR family transcriptional regulator PadR
LILKTLARGLNHGYAIARFIEETTRRSGPDRRRVALSGPPSPERTGWVEAEWATSELGRRAKLYRISEAGGEQLAAAMATWKKFAAGISKVLFAS